ncbi:MAG TPA: M1 family aminopeptidase [Candidatus Limnocylindria bacterium]
MPAPRAMASIVILVSGMVWVPVAQAATTTRLTQRYAISATLDVATGRLDAVAELELTNRSATAIDHVNLSVIPRALGYLTLDGPINVDGVDVPAEWTTTINLRVPLEDLEPRAMATIRVPFRLDIARSPDAFTARTSRENGVLSFGQWFPIVSTEHEVYGMGDPQISFTAESVRLELTSTVALPRDAVACPGLVDAPETNGTTWTCESTRVRDFSFVVNPRFRLTQRTVDGVDLRVYTETVSGDTTASLASDALTRLSDAFGAYPWDDLVLAEVGTGGGFSMEYPRMIHLTRDKVTDTYVVYHEVAHQWFYGQVGNDQQAEPWLDEGFADFSARWLMGIGENQCSTRPVDSEVFAWPAGATTGGDWASCDGYFHAVFYRGTELLNAVRSAMGDDEFFAAIRSWVARQRYGFVSGDRLLGHLQRESAVDLRPVFRGYLAEPRPWQPVRSGLARPI